MPRLLALDIGAKRTGIAVSDPQKIIATSLQTVDTKELMSFLISYFQKEEVEIIIVGMPKNLKNQDTDNTPLVRNYLEILNKQFPNHIIKCIDERFTSSIALDTMIAGGMKKKDRREKGNVDKISATLILQSYMESNKG